MTRTPSAVTQKVRALARAERLRDKIKQAEAAAREQSRKRDARMADLRAKLEEAENEYAALDGKATGPTSVVSA